MNNEVSGSPSNSSDKNIEIMNTKNTNIEARTVVVEVDKRISVDMQDENNENDEARAVVEVAENRIITHEKKKKKKKENQLHLTIKLRLWLNGKRIMRKKYCILLRSEAK